MRNRWLSRTGLIALLGLAVVTGGGVGCSEADPINRVQPDYIKKADLVGPNKDAPYEWYIRNTVIDTGRSNSFAFPGLQDELKRVRWDIEENHLIARRSYELVSGSDGKGADPKKNDGTIVASYPIIGQFDIRRDYNPATGEENNVVVENTERPWYERDYIRVDWSRNEVNDPEGLFWFDKIFGEVQFQPTGYYEKDPKSPSAPVYQQDKGYMDITAKWTAKTENFYGIQGLPACTIMNYYTGSDVMECNEQEIQVRTAFKRVVDTDYEALETDSAKWAMFGTFNRDRYGFSRQYELLDKQWHRLVGRHNLWKKSHASQEECYAPQAGEDAETSRKNGDASCEQKNGAGSRCDLYAGEVYGKKGLCTIPLAKREVKAVPYFVSRNMPQDLWETNQVIINQWNDAMVTAIAVGREVECRRGGGDKDSCHAQFFDGEAPKASNGPAVVLCHNPATEADHPNCGGKGTIAREGDLRYSLIAWVDQPLKAAPLGYGPNGADPLTGEVVQSTAYIYGASLDNYATMARDLVRVANGELDPQAYALGQNVSGDLGQFQSTAYHQDLFQPYADFLAGKATDAAVKTSMSPEQIKKAHAAVDVSQTLSKLGAVNLDGQSPTARLASVQGAIASRGIEGRVGFGGQAEALSRMNSMAQRLQGSQTEQTLTGTTEWQQYNAIPVPITQNAANDEKLLKTAQQVSSPFGGSLNPMAMSNLFQKMDAVLEARGECMFGTNEFNAPHFEGLARRFKSQYANDPNGLFLELRKLIYKAVTEHEVGHTMSMRHNFQGSWDSVNFHPNYWKLRTKDGAAAQACTAARADGSPDTCMGPRYLDPSTVDEDGAGATAHPGIEEFAYSSIMDYGYDFNTDLHGLGSYDRAMMKFVYGNAVETFQPGSKVAAQMAPLNAIPGQTMPRGPISEQWWVKRTDAVVGGGEQVQPTHYTTLARIMQTEKLLFDASRCRDPRADLGEDYSAIDGKICAPPEKDHASVLDLQSGEVEPGIQGNLYKTADGRIRWPYRFGTDEYSTYPHNLRFDAGADVYEAAVNVAKLYEYRYILDFWRRGRRGWTAPIFGGGRIWDRYFSRMHSIGWLSASKITMYSAMYPSVGANPALLSADWGQGYVLASNVLFNSLERAMLRVQPGNYTQKASVPGRTQDILEVPDFNEPKTSTTRVSVLDGRWIDDDLNTSKGGSFHYQNFHDRLGTYMEKPLAIAGLAAQFPPMNVYYSRDTYVDGRNMMLNFRSIYPAAYDRLIAGTMANDTDVLAPYTVGNATKDKASVIEYPDVLTADYKYPAGAKILDPLVGYKLQVPVIIYGLYLGQDDGSRSFQSSARVWIEGASEGFTIPDNEKEFFFEVDQNGGSGVLWAAHILGTELQNGTFARAKGIGHRMIQHANMLLAGAYAIQTNADGTAKYDAVTHRPLWEAGKEGQYRAYASADDAAAAQKEYKRYIGVLNVVRGMMWDTRSDLNGF